MKVRKYLVTDNDEQFEGEVWLSDCFPDPPSDDWEDENGEPVDEFSIARDELLKSGRAYVGGGAAPLFLLMRIR